MELLLLKCSYLLVCSAAWRGDSVMGGEKQTFPSLPPKILGKPGAVTWCLNFPLVLGKEDNVRGAMETQWKKENI